jgi:hypothetical protein
MTVRLDSRWRDAIGGTTAADRDQVPDAEESSRQQHEQQATGNEEDEQVRKLDFSRACTGKNLLRRFRLAGKGLNLCAIHFQKMSALPCSTSVSMGIAGEAENVAQQLGIDGVCPVVGDS